MVRRLFICSAADSASVNIRDALIASAEWDDTDGILYHDDTAMITIPEMHIYADNVDDIAVKKGVDAEEMIFLSRHRSSSGIPTLTVHPIGNFHDADLGGRPRTLVKAAPRTMTGILKGLASSDTKGFGVSFEVTHHGPWVNVPSAFVEIGSDETQWNNRAAANIIADALLNKEDNDHISAIGIGGGHYAPRFTEVALKYKVNIGHMIPEYAFANSDDEDVARMVREAAEKSCTKTAYVHKRSMKGAVAKRITDVVISCGLETISSADLDVIRE
ncbi:MAG: D-aminoacyl-tRNA deacylase [Methanomassiliicoccaceae archaeon]|nr:D-aminoacyl-tRNA deacylase [Methanomassiliicoccaceae archaeon]